MVGYNNPWQVNAAVAKVRRLRLEILNRSDDIKCLPRRWVVERTFSCFGRNRRPRIREPRRNPRYLCHLRFNPAHPQSAACQGVGREFHKSPADSAQ
jgi:hypothetical protein